ncbi:WXG100 family type VII secretion target [Nocardia jiangsuensis]|uniref:WXG100 family type VII secretion target n=1 Tax=Nocardia jiangsuensis TaxID=1691563 RepID=A0ABV8E2L7_9NOCA
MTSRDELLRQIDTIRSGQSAIDELPSKVQDWHGKLASLIRTNGAAAAATGNVAAPVLAERQVDLVWKNRDDINSALGETGDRLAGMEPGLNVPVEFIDFALQWRNVKNDINNAFTAISETVLYTEWQGDASNRYRDIHQRQGLACTSLSEAATQIAGSLENIAAAELALYTDLATKIQDMINTVTNLTGSYISSALNFPMGYITASSNLVSATQASKSLVLGLATSIADNALTNMVEGNKVYDAVAAPRGLPAGRWPPAVVTSYGYGIEAVRDAIGDASVTDGDKSDWEL